MLNREILLENFEKTFDKDTKEYKTCIGLIKNMKGYRVKGDTVYFCLGVDKNMGSVTYKKVNELMLNAIGSGDIPEMNEKGVAIEKVWSNRERWEKCIKY